MGDSETSTPQEIENRSSSSTQRRKRGTDISLEEGRVEDEPVLCSIWRSHPPRIGSGGVISFCNRCACLISRFQDSQSIRVDGGRHCLICHLPTIAPGCAVLAVGERGVVEDDKASERELWRCGQRAARRFAG